MEEKVVIFETSAEADNIFGELDGYEMAPYLLVYSLKYGISKQEVSTGDVVINIDIPDSLGITGEDVGFDIKQMQCLAIKENHVRPGVCSVKSLNGNRLSCQCKEIPQVLTFSKPVLVAKVLTSLIPLSLLLDAIALCYSLFFSLWLVLLLLSMFLDYNAHIKFAKEKVMIDDEEEAEKHAEKSLELEAAK